MKMGKIAAISILILGLITDLACSYREPYKTENLNKDTKNVIALDEEKMKQEIKNTKSSEVISADSSNNIKNINKDDGKKADPNKSIKNKKQQSDINSKANTKSNTQNIVTNQDNKKGENQIKSQPQVTYKDGIYVGSSQGKNGEIKVQVTVKNGKIYNIEILSHSDTQNLFDIVYKKIINAVYERQSAEVEIVSGATLSSNGLIKAISNALEEANNQK